MNKFFVSIFLLLQTFVVVAQNAKSDTLNKPLNTSDRYSMLTAKATEAVLNEDFEQAKALYTEALAIKPKDNFVLGMLDNVNNSIKAMEVIRQRNDELKRKADINILLNKAQAEVMARDYENARLHYSQVLDLKPVKSQEDFATQKIKALDLALASTNKSSVATAAKSVREEPVKGNVKNDQKVINGSKVMEPETDVTSAQKTGSPVSQLTKEEPRQLVSATGEKKQVAQLNQEMAKTNQAKDNGNPVLNKPTIANKSESVKEEQKMAANSDTNEKNKTQSQPSEKAAREQVKNAKFESIAESAIKAINAGDLQTALKLYNEVLTMNPTPQQEKAIYSEIIAIRRNLEKNQINTAGTVIAKSSKTPETSTNQSPVINSPVSKDGKNGVATKGGKAIPTPTRALQNETNDVAHIADNTTKALSNPVSNSSQLISNRDDIEFGKKMLPQSSLSYLTDNNNQVTLTCQGVAKKGNNLFLKFLVQNNSNTEFTIGQLQSSYIKTPGQLVKLNPRYLVDNAGSSKREFYLILVAENQSIIEPNEVLIFELEDQQKKTQLALNISGEIFSNKLARAF